MAAQPANGPSPSFVKTADGLIVYPEPGLSGSTAMVRLQVVRPGIIRVLAAPVREPAASESLVTTIKGQQTSGWTVTQGKEAVTLSTSQVSARIVLRTGAVTFLDAAGRTLLAEQAGGRRFEPGVAEGQPTYAIGQQFASAPGEAYYGLGQHQDNLMNQRGYQVTLFQNNTEVAVPFLLSNRNYGVLWDNYAITRAGDTRPYRPLSALRLFAYDGTPGWLTATYHNDRNKPGEVLFRRAESVIDYEYLNDYKRLPPEFKLQQGAITWEGSFASAIAGAHKLRFTYGGYLKVWINGELRLDRWRMAWNPGSAILDLDLEEGVKVPIKIQWYPDGGESYVSAKYLEPKPGAPTFGFQSEAGQKLDYYFIQGANADSVIAGYRALTGKATLLPRWAFGKWQSRERYKTQEEVVQTVAEFRKRRIPLDNIVLDWSYWKEDAWGSQEFEAARFPSPDSMIARLHRDYNTRFMISVWPKFYEGIPAYNDFDKKGWLYKRNVADRQRDWIGKGYVSTFYDAFNPGARQGFWDLINTRLFQKGVDAWWMDASEPDILSNASPEKRKEQMQGLAIGPVAEYLNAYPLQNAKGIYEGQRGTRPDQRVFILTRSAFAGQQRYAAVTWSGDIAARWHDMEAQIPAGINFSLSGIPYWTMDIGGFAVERRYEQARGEDLEEWREQNVRWYQFGAFTPLFRVHGQFPFREIYNTAPETHPAYQSMLYYDKLRYRLLPYVYSLAGAAYHQGGTLMRGLVMDFNHDTAVLNIHDQYLFGPSLLINPVYTYKQRTRRLYLPAGQGWYDLYTGRYQHGGQWITADAPYERMPLYVKEGSIVPFGPELQYTDERPADTITLFVYTGKDARFTLYEDEGTDYGYEKGAFTHIPMKYMEATKTLTLENREGSFPGMLGKRVFRVVWIGRDKPLAMEAEQIADAVLHYDGWKVETKR